MPRSTRRRASRRRDERVPAVAAVLGYGLLLVLINVLPGWQSLPVLTSAASSAVALVNLALIVLLVSRAVALVEPAPRVRAIASYLVALIALALISDVWGALPFDFGDEPQPWITATHLVLAGVFVWVVIVGARSAVGVVRGRRATRLAPGHA